MCVLLVNEVLLDQGGQKAGQVGIVQLLSRPLGREPSGRGEEASLAEAPDSHKCPPKQNIWVSFLPKPWRKGHTPSVHSKLLPCSLVV